MSEFKDEARMFTLHEVLLIVDMVISYCEYKNGNGIKVPVDAIVSGVSAGDDPGDGDGPSGYGYFDRVVEWVKKYGAPPIGRATNVKGGADA